MNEPFSPRGTSFAMVVAAVVVVVLLTVWLLLYGDVTVDVNQMR